MLSSCQDANRAHLEYVGAASVPLRGYARGRVSLVAVPLTLCGIAQCVNDWWLWVVKDPPMGWN